MRKFNTMLLAGTLLFSLQTRAINLSDAEVVPPDPCANIEARADLVIRKQGELIELQTDRIGQLRTENEQLQAAVVGLKEQSDKESSRPLLYGVVGVALGAVATSLLVHH